ncbi:hypothetical protein SCAR479_00987 [Seiridium cardinale]|uniref:DUF7730 domain-containing protein n=1 Tax=Seiridium cardinale TaxID=138064 RepID=A0ABR2Y7D2_9PEZI
MSQSPGFDWDYGAVKARFAPSDVHCSPALLTACRTIYLEAIDVLYWTHNLHFSTMISMSIFPRVMIPHHLELLRHVRLSLSLFVRGNEIHSYLHNSFSQDWPGWDEASAPGDTPWDGAWKAIGELKSLRTLLVTLEVTPDNKQYRICPWYRSMPKDFETQLFQPLKQITCDDFLVRVNWPHIAQDTPAYPFRLECYEKGKPET